MSDTNSLDHFIEDKATPCPTSKARPWWRKWALPAAALLVLVGLALGLGLGLGLKMDHSDDKADNNNNPGTTSDSNGDGNPSGSGNATRPARNTTNHINSSMTSMALNAQWQIDLIQTLSVSSDGFVSPNGASNPSISVYDIDLFNHQNLTTVRDLQKLGMTVICYFSSGSYEDNRPDSRKFQASDKGSELDGWPGEYWLNLSSSNVRSIMSDRIAIAASVGCDAIDPDNVDGYDNANGLGLTPQDSIDFVRFLASEAAKYGMMTGLKNAADVIDGVLDVVAFSVNEECVANSECDSFAAFPQNGKPVFNIEYPLGTKDISGQPFSADLVSKYCDKSSTGNGGTGFNTVLKGMTLDGFVEYCNSKVYTTNGQ
ncbi:hypothetical protein OC846_001449 [Tilletia horrida]|uniref:alpha-galactosidase n=1 Tax=Tilletia horrida TaxID=155126 RepID=A0AAN6GU31_9BASI|nr:hypothetical protein OC846_001449 [Tilletia horrida]KAK0569023.1 hypothetical protein OC861_001364 [Tilletia horrida]